MIYIKNAPWLDYSLIISPNPGEILHKILDDLTFASGKKRKDAIRGIEIAFGVIVANLLLQRAVHPDIGIQVDLSNDGYPKGAFNPHKLGIRAMRHVIGYMETSNPPMIYKRGGNYDRKSNISYPTQISGSEELFDIIFEHINNEIARKNTNIKYTYPITRNDYDYTTYLAIFGDILQKSETPAIRMREGSSKKGGRFMDFKTTPEISEMENRISTINTFIEKGGTYNLFIPDKDFNLLCNTTGRNSDGFDNFDSRSETLDLISRRRLHRVFNDGTFEHGGRFYGGWWQSIPSDYRRFITINDIPTVEVDYSNMQLAMLYAKIGQQLDGDAYAIDGIDPRFRPLIKMTTLKLINGKGRIEAPLKSQLPANMTWEDLQQAVREKHKAIARYFGSGEGIRLQRLDSDIAETVLMEMMDKGILTLPVHDSFIVAEGHLDSLCDTMLDVYQRKMGGKTLGLKRTQTLFYDRLMGHDNLTTIERHNLGMTLFHAKREEPAYKGYRRREEIFNSIRRNESKADHRTKPPLDEATTSNFDVNQPSPRERIKQLGRWIVPKPMIQLWDRFSAR